MEKILLALEVNGRAVEREVDPSLSLLRFLREELGLMGAKNGCGKGQCGACAVIVDGRLRRSCVLKAANFGGSRVLTVEALAGPEGLHPIQRAFVLEGAVQCGFCTPGMVMAAKALLDSNPDPSDAEIEAAFKDNLCRCTGYAAIRRAVRRAARELGGELCVDASAIGWKGAVGHPLPRRDAPARARGEPLYTEDLADLASRGIFPEGTLGPCGEQPAKPLYGAMLFSARGHARIASVDTGAAEAAPGVARILLAGDVPGRNAFGLFVPQQPVIAGELALYLGEVLAVVLAETSDEARAARDQIRVEYVDLRARLDPEANLAPGAELVHPEDGSNVAAEYHVRKGDPDAAFEAAEVVVEGEFETQAVEHAYLEPEACMAVPGPGGSVTVYTGNQGSEDYRAMIAASLALPPEKVRVVLTACGGGFGGKEEPTVQIQAALGALLTGRPVRIALTREESIRMSTKRHPMRIRMTHAADADGRLLAVTSRAVADAGAYLSQTGPVVFRSAVTAGGPYEVPSVRADSYGVYTHRNPSGAFRGFGSTQVCFACEVQMDELARALGLDPAEIRRRNAFREGSETCTGQALGGGVGYLGTLEAAAEGLARLRAKYGSAALEPGRRRGFGLASSYKNVGIGTGLSDKAGGIVELLPSGRFSVRTGAADIGQGSDTVAAQAAAEALGLPPCLFEVSACDTATCPDGGMTTASRQTYVTGNAVRTAAQELRSRLEPFFGQVEGFEGILAAPSLRSEVAWLRDPRAQSALERAAAALRELRERALAAGVSCLASVDFLPPATRAHRTDSRRLPGEDSPELGIHYAYCFASAAVAVEVDEASGAVRVLEAVAAQDVGRAINPLSLRGQIEGAVAMGLGYALTEDFVAGEKAIVTDDLRKLGVPRIADVPPIETVVIEVPQPGGPFGAKGMGEVGLNPIAPAVSNAIFDAVGVRLRSLPMTPAKVLAALRDMR